MKQKYTREFKLEAVRLSENPDRTAAEVARGVQVRRDRSAVSIPQLLGHALVAPRCLVADVSTPRDRLERGAATAAPRAASAGRGARPARPGRRPVRALRERQRFLHRRGRGHLAGRHDSGILAAHEDDPRLLQHLGHHKGALLAGRVAVLRASSRMDCTSGASRIAREEALLAHPLARPLLAARAA